MNKAKKVQGPPRCSAGGREYALTLNEQYQGSVFCGDCGQRFPIQGKATTVIPTHTITPDLHELRRKLEREHGQ
jgi:hypothetical protein